MVDEEATPTARDDGPTASWIGGAVTHDRQCGQFRH
jgi:hypothetical protein